MTTRTVTGTLSYVEREASSASGNPRWAIALDTGGYEPETYVTGIDASVGYEVTNFRAGRKVTLTLKGKREAVIGMEYSK